MTTRRSTTGNPTEASVSLQRAAKERSYTREVSLRDLEKVTPPKVPDEQSGEDSKESA